MGHPFRSFYLAPFLLLRHMILFQQQHPPRLRGIPYFESIEIYSTAAAFSGVALNDTVRDRGGSAPTAIDASAME